MKKILYAFAFLSFTASHAQLAKVVNLRTSKATYTVAPSDTIGFYVTFDKAITTEKIQAQWVINGSTVYYFGQCGSGCASAQDSLILVTGNTYYAHMKVKTGGVNLSDGKFVSGTGYFQVLIGNNGVNPLDAIKSPNYTLNLTPTGLEEESFSNIDNSTLVALYDLNGMKLTEPKSGVMVAVYSNGMTRKIVMQ